MTQVSTATNWDVLCENVADSLTGLAEYSQLGDGGRARIMFFALAGFLDERGIIDGLKAAAVYLQEGGAAQDAPPSMPH
jgi:hypothetical protein